MSGEAYGNLWLKDPDELWQAREDLERMAERLAHLGHADAATETFAVLAEVRAHHARLEASMRRLEDVWHAVDYFDSSDAGPERIDEAVKVYREGDVRGPYGARGVSPDGRTPNSAERLLSRIPSLVREAAERERSAAPDTEAPRTVPEVLAEYEGGLEP